MVLAGRECTEEDLWQVLDRELYQSMMDHGPFLREDFALMVGKGKWVVIPYLVDMELPGLRMIPLGVKEDCDQLPVGIYCSLIPN